MPALIGRKVRFKKGPVLTAVGIVGAQDDQTTMNNTEVDITDKDDNGYRTLLDDWGVRSIDITVTGVMKDDDLIDTVTSSTGSVLLQEYVLDMDAFGEITGDFWLQSVQLGATTSEGVSFTATFLSSGEYTFTPAA